MADTVCQEGEYIPKDTWPTPYAAVAMSNKAGEDFQDLHFPGCLLKVCVAEVPWEPGWQYSES